MFSNVTGSVFETNCEIGRPAGVADPCNTGSFCTEPGSPNLPQTDAVSIKAGLLSPGDFSGTPLTATIIFENPFADTSYVITLSGVDARIFSYQSKTVDGFVVNTNADGALTGEVSWLATPVGEL